MDSRRHFLGKVASGLAGTLAAVPAQVLGANERIRAGFIGFGDRATELFNHLRACPNTEAAAFCDIYTKQLDRAKGLAPGAATYLDYRRLLEDKSLDAIVIATPQHLHAEHFCAALDAGKQCVSGKDDGVHGGSRQAHARGLPQDAGKHAVQIGHQSCSSGHMTDVQQFLSDPERMGKITMIDMHMYRNTRTGSRSGRARRALLPTSTLKIFVEVVPGPKRRSVSSIRIAT